ncbi:hypothetical protein HNP84_010253 [Thermocatellispora tengchongensis]|uniref:Uncharacterized protein n=1 Tax=Thermocatellispora tengchongensis TaxID=1073253 RepID=A0A840PXA7_9ACTN|nr:hypothetical protein [Thermocatellispora tengchongensis]MBB5140485.1 hypothetical protein [Thermocatellispora tengchongensis]
MLAGSVVAALLAGVILRLRDRVHRRLDEAETADRDGDTVPDVYQAAAGRLRPGDDARQDLPGASIADGR